MPADFAEWVRHKAEESRSDPGTTVREEWQATVTRLIGQMQEWLGEAVGEGIKIRREMVDRSEQGLGTYEVPGLEIQIGSDAVEVVPVGRYVVGHVGPHGLVGPRASGRVDVRGGARKYALYHTPAEAPDAWYVVDERGNVSPLTQEGFQQILMDLMS